MQHPTKATSPANYHSLLSAAADKTFLILAAVIGVGSLILAAASGRWLPFLALTLPTIALLAAIVRLMPGTLFSRNTTALALMTLVATTIEQSNGLVEVHFGVFVVLALLLYYRDWRPVLTGAVAIASHHLLFFWMQSRGLPIHAFAVGSDASILLLHAGYVAVETVFVCKMAIAMRHQIDVLGANPLQLKQLAIDIAHGLPVDHSQFANLREGTLGDALRQMFNLLTERQQREFELNDANAKIRTALDASRTGMMIADADHIIRYANHSVMNILGHQIEQLQAAFPDFELDTLVGSSIHRFHANPDRIRGMLDRMTGMHHGQIRIGNASFDQFITPVIDENGQRSGFAVEWHDRTDELQLEENIAAITACASAGDFSKRIAQTGLKGFIAKLSGNINTLLDTMTVVTGEVRRMLGALSEGNLDHRITGDYQGDLAAMKNDANGTAEQLTHMIERIRTCAEAIQSAASEIASGNEDLSGRTEQQAANLEETAASMEQLTVTVRHNAETSQHANQLTQNAVTVAERGGQVVDQVVSTMQTIEQSSRRIGDIIAVIDGIAFQTNILALNAAVEAARAGEQGRGFAVVAGEVRSLAQRSANAAREIKHLITDSVDKVTHGAVLVRQAGDTMQEVVGSVRHVGQMMDTLTQASRQQSEGIDQVRTTVVQMDASTQQNAALVEEAHAAARALEDEASTLMEAVSRFSYESAMTQPSHA